MKNLMTIFSVVVLFAFAMTTIGCDKKKEGTTLTVTVAPTNHVGSDAKLDVDKIKTAETKVTVKLGSKQNVATYVTLLAVKEFAGEATVQSIGTGQIAKDGETVDITVAMGLTAWKIGAASTEATAKDAKYAFHALATNAAFSYTAPSTRPKTLADAWNAILGSAKKDNKSTVVANKQSFATLTQKEAAATTQ